ncbi:MAG: NEW3 domain-containing protein [Candidatus Aenigmatarchaeota archaeon]
MKLKFLLIIMLFLILFSLKVEATIGDFQEERLIQIESQNYIDAYLNWTFQEINSTHWFASFTFNASFLQDAKSVFTKPCSHGDWAIFQQKYFPEYDKNKVCNDIKNITNYPYQELTSSIKIQKVAVDFNNGFASFYIVFPEGFKEGERAKFGFNSTIISTTTTVPFYPNQRAICRDGKNFIHVVWLYNSTAVKYARSIDNGNSWQITTWGNETASALNYPHISCDGNNITVVYSNTSLVMKISENNGETWETKLPRTSGVDIPLVERRGQRIYVVYKDTDTYPDINFFNSSDAGTTWSSNVVLFYGTTDFCDIDLYFRRYFYTPSFIVNGTGTSNDVLHVIADSWLDTDCGGNDRRLTYRNSTNAGETWRGYENGNTYIVLRSSPLSTFKIYPSITFNTSNVNNIYVSWVETSGNNLIYFSNSTNGGVSWTTPYQINTTNNVKNYSSITINNVNSPIVFWQENYTNYNIVYRNYTGSSWDSLMNLTIDKNAQYINTKWNYAGNCIELVYMNGTASPYSITYDKIGTCEFPANYSLNSTNSTLAGTFVEHRLKWNSNNGLSGYIFSFWNGSDIYVTPSSVYNCSGSSNTPHDVNETINKDPLYPNTFCYPCYDWEYFGNPPFWVTYDMGFTMNISKFSIFTNNEYGAPCNITGIYVSDNPNNFGQSLGYCELNPGPSESWAECSFNSKYGRYINLTFISRNSTGHCSVSGSNLLTDFYEIVVYVSWINDNWQQFTSDMCPTPYTECWSNVTKKINSTVGATIKWRVYVNDSGNYLIESEIFSYITDQAPTISISSPGAGSWHKEDFNVTYSATDNIAIDKCLLYTRDGSSGSWVYREMINCGTNQNVTITVGSSKYCSIQGLNQCGVRIWANDTSGNSNQSERNFSIDFEAPTYSNDADNSSGVISSGSVINVSVLWSDAQGLSKAILRHNLTGAWVNNTTYSFPGNPSWFNSTINTSFTDQGKKVCWNQWANDTSDNWNNTMPENVHCFILQGPPTLAYNLTSPVSGSSYIYGNTYTFNITVCDPNGYNDIYNVTFEWESSNTTLSYGNGCTYHNSSCINCTISKTDLAVGSYNYKWYANDSINTWDNLSATYVVNKGTPSLSLTSSGGWSITYPSSNNVTGSETNNGDNDCTYNFYRDNNLANSENGLFIVLGAGNHPYVYNTSGCTNYSSNSISNTLVVSQGTPDVKVFTNTTSSDESQENRTVTYPTTVTIKGNSSTDITPPSFNLYIINVTPTSPAISLSNLSNNPATLTVSLGAGTYRIFYNTSGNANWSANSNDTIYLIVNKGDPSPYLKLYINDSATNQTINYPNVVNISANETVTNDEDCVYILWRNNTQLISGSSVWNITKLGNGTYSFKYNTSGCANWSVGSSETLYLYVNKGIPNLALTSNISWSTAYPNASNVTGYGCPIDGASDFNCTLYRNSSSINPVANSSGSSMASELVLLGVGKHLYVWNISNANPENWTYSSTSNILEINKTATSVTLYLNGTNGDRYYQYGEVANLTAVLNVSQIQTPISFYTNFTGSYQLWDTDPTPSQSYTNITTLSFSLGPKNVTANFTNEYNYTSSYDSHVLTIWGWANVTEISPNTGSEFNRSIIPITCKVRDANTSENIENYPVNFYKNATFLGTNLTNSSGIAIWYWNSYSDLGPYTIKCNITDNESLYYNDSINQKTSNITIWRVLNLDLTLNPNEIYRNNSFSPYISTFIANLTDENGAVSGAGISFYESSSQVGSSTTNSSGIATLNRNPDDEYDVGNYTILANLTNALSYSYPYDDVEYLIIKGVLKPKIDSPNSSYHIFHKNETISLLSTIKDENGNYLSPVTFNWTLDSENIYYGISEDTTWQVPISHSSGQFNLNLTTNKTYYSDGWDSYTIEIWDYYIIVNSPVNYSILHKTQNVSLNASLRDEKDNSIAEYSQFNWILNGTNVGSGNVTNWIVDANQNLGLSELNATARISYSSGFYDKTNTTFVYIYGWSNVGEILPYDGSYPQGTLINVTCKVFDSNTSNAIANYPVKFYKNDILQTTNLTNSSGIAIWYWNTSEEYADSYTIKCNITDNESLYYNFTTPNENSTIIGISAVLQIDQIVKQYDEIYRNDSYQPYNSTISVHVVKAALGNADNANVSFYNSTSLIGNCTTNATGWCNITFNPDNTIEPQNYSIYINATKTGFQSSETENIWLIVKGVLSINIDSPVKGSLQKIHRGENFWFNSTVKDENDNILSDANVNWYNSSWYLMGSGINNTITFPIDHPLSGSTAIYANASKIYYDNASDSVIIRVFSYSSVNITYPISESFNRGSIVNIICKVKDSVNSWDVKDYPVKFWNDSTNVYNGITNETGYANYSWNTSYLSVGNHMLNCTIASNSTLFYDVNVSNSYSYITLIGNLTAQLISVSQTIIYRNDSFSPHYSNIAVRVLDEYSNPISDANVSFYENESYIGFCYPTNSTGHCVYLYNASDTLTPGNYSIKFNATKQYYNPSLTNETYIAVKGKLYPNITYVPSKTYRNETIQLNSTTRDENGNFVIPEFVIWYLNQTNISSLDNTQENITYQIPINQQTGQYFFNVSVNKTWYDSFYNITDTQIWTKANITLYYPIDLTYNRGSDITYYANVTDYYNSSPVANYNCSWWLDGLNINSSLTNSQGTCNWTWPTSCENLTRDYAGLHSINASITSNSTIFYDTHANNSYTTTTLLGFLNILIDSPNNNSVWHKTDSLWLNSTVKSECLESIENPTVTWKLNNTEIDSGVNVSWEISENQTPGFYFINSTANKTYYNSAYNITNINIWGWANVSWIYPATGNYPYGDILNLTCKVIDANNSTGIYGYNVDFWKNESYVNSNTTIFDGNATFIWDTSPEELGLFMWKCNITNNETLYYNVSLAEAFSNITLVDGTPPTLSNLSIIPNSSFETNYNYTNITVDAFDNFAVDKVWAQITLPNSTKVNVTMLNISTNTYRGNYTPVLHGLHNVTVFANDTSNNIANITSNFTAIGYTNFTLELSNTSITASGITLDTPYIFDLGSIANNTGNGTARFVNISLSLPNGVSSNSSLETCGNLSVGENCTKGFKITINTSASIGNYPLTVTTSWSNPDFSLGNKTNQTSLTVQSNPYLKVEETSIINTVSHGATKDVGSFTLNSTGNDITQNIVCNITRITIPESWTIIFNPSCPSSLSGSGSTSTPHVYILTPTGENPGLYYGNITVYSDSQSRDWLWLNITVLEDWSWDRTPEIFSTIVAQVGTSGNVGNITINNLGNLEIVFGLAKYENASSLISINPSTSISVNKQSTNNVTVSYTIPSEQTMGMYLAKIQISNSSANPTAKNTSFWLNVTDLPPQVENVTIDKTTPEVNKENVTIDTDIVDNIGVNTAWINVSLPQGGYEIKNMIQAPILPNRPNRYAVNYTPTQAGFHLVKIYANDSNNLIGTNETNFTAVANTTIIVISENKTISGITQENGANPNVNVTLNNTGLGKAYNVNVSFSLPSGWVANPSILYYGNVSKQSNVSNQTTILIPQATLPGIYQISITANWTNADDSLGINTTIIFVNVTSNPILDIIESFVNSTTQHGKSNYTLINLTSKGNDNVTNILINCSGSQCTDFNISFNPNSIPLLEGGDYQIVNISFTVPVGYSPGIYPLTINASGNVYDTTVLNITVPENKTWNRNPENFPQLSVGLNSQGDIGIINITNYGNVPITFNISITNDTENATQHIFVNVTNITIDKQSSGYVKINYSSPEYIEPSSVVYNVTIKISNLTASPDSLNTTASIKVYKFKIEILSPNQTNPTSLYAGNITEIHVNATLGDAILGTGENILWNVSFGDTACPLSGTPYYDEVNGYWIINCTAPSLTDATYYTLNVLGNYTNETLGIYNTLASDSETNAIYYIDITPPSLIAYANSVPIGNNASIRANVTDNLDVSLSIAEVTYPNASKFNYTMINIQNISEVTIWEYNLTNVEYGDYDVKVYAKDTTDNWNSNTTWFEAYNPNLVWFNGTTLDKDSNPVIINFSLYRPSTTIKLYNFSSNESGSYSKQIKQRNYDFNILAFNDVINLKNVSIIGNVGNDTAAPISLDNIPPSQIGSGVRISKAIYIQTILNYTNATFVLNYSGTSYTAENYLGIYRCDKWAFSSRNCTSNWNRINSTLNTTLKTLTIETTDLSGTYAAAEFICGDGNCETNYGETFAWCASDCHCGNGVCESSLGETTENCPTDCAQAQPPGGGAPGGGIGPVIPPTEIEAAVPISLSTSLIEVRLYPGEYQITSIGITNNKKENIQVSLSVDGDIWPFTLLEKDKITIGPKQTEYAKIKFFTMPTTIPGVYNGNIIVKTAETTQKISVILRVEYEREKLLDIKVDTITKEVIPGDKLKYQVTLYNLGLTKRVDVFINYTVKSVANDKIIATDKETLAIETTLSVLRTIFIPEVTEPGLYTIEAFAWYENRTASSVATFSVVKPPWIYSFLLMIFTNWITYVILFVAIPCFYLGWKAYEKWKVEKKIRARYIKPVNLNKLPTKGLWLGKVAETNANAFFDEDKLTTHMIIAGGTGSGKTVAGMVMAEECLKKGISVIVFDPTAQWTGFIRPCKDKVMLNLYSKFGIKPEEARGFKGTIVQIKDPFLKVEIEKYIKEGEITVFVLNKLTPDQLDYFVRKTIDYMFTIPWEESRKLKALFVFDEVHRLLPKFAKQTGVSLGGEGYLAIERACREFRKWGLGLVMISQVLLDFRGAIRAVIATESQMRTKYEGDIERIKTKYGWEYSAAIPKLEVGTGMIQNPEYNDGKPWFIRFRPLLHDSFRLTEEELSMYEDYMKQIEELGKKIETLKSRNIDTYDMELELKLAVEKVKTAQMRMAETYIESVKSRIKTVEERS